MPQVFVHSRGEFTSLPESFLADKAIIRMHNANDTQWYPHKEKNAIVMFFNDMKTYDLSFIDKIKANHFSHPTAFTKEHCLNLLAFIQKNRKKDVVVHCEWGKSRSVSVALYLQNRYKYDIMNRTPEELEHFNDWVLVMLNKYGQ